MSSELNQSSTVTCPTCGAILQPRAEAQFFCEYCGQALGGWGPDADLLPSGPTEHQADETPDWLMEMSRAASLADEEDELPEWLPEPEPESDQQAEPEATTTERQAAPERGLRGRPGRATCAAIVAGTLVLGILCLLGWVLCSSLSSWSFNVPLLGQRSKVVTVMASRPWQSAGIRVRPGQVVSITYLDGTWSVLGGSRGMQNRTDAAGFEDEYRTPGLPVANAPVGALLGRIGDGPPFVVGREVRFRSAAAGLLQMMINDQWLSDNVGALRVRVEVTSGE